MSEPAENDARIARALHTIERLQARLRRAESAEKAAQQAAEAAARAPIAVLGLACRYPGGADTPAAFWQLLDEGRDAIGPVPADRWDADALHDPDPAAPGRIVTREGGFVPGPELFDARFFGIAPREAASMDPQQRLLLELAWHALEDAGIAAPTLAGRPVGVFVGLSSHDYSHRLLLQPPEAIDAYLATGNAHSVAAGRLSYSLGLTGPSLVVDTACSSSLVALHQACQSLRAGECELALVGGVNRILSPAFSINFSRARMLAPDGRCKAFSAAADGFGRGEGGGVLVLQRLADARRDGRRVLALVRGSAVNQDGRSGGLTVPNGPAQQAVIRQALAQAGLAPAEVDVVEAHGTGTTLGDPIEAQALGAVYGEGRAPERPLALGSVKANLGHLEAAAGLCGALKMVLALQHQRLPRQLHATPPSPHIDWAALPLALLHAPRDWPADAARPRRAGVSSFGFSGTNAHVILEGPEGLAPDDTAATVAPPADGLNLLLLSARDPQALRALAAAHARRLAAGSPWAAHCDSARRGRAALPRRLALQAGSSAQAAQLLQDWLGKDADDGSSAHDLNQHVWQATAPAGAPRVHTLAPHDLASPQALAQAAQAFVGGAELAWPGAALPRVDLPLYPFQRQRQRHWIELPQAAPGRAASESPAATAHPLLGRALAVVGDATPRFEALLAAHAPAWVADHTVFGQVVLPAAGLAQIALAAGLAASAPAAPFGHSLHDVVFLQALRLDLPRRVQTLCRADGDGWRVEIHSAAGDTVGAAPAWVQHASARVAAAAVPVNPDTAPRLADLRAQAAEAAAAGQPALSATACLQRLADQGVAYGPAFAALRHAQPLGEDTVLAELELPAQHSDADLAALALQPILLDAALQSLAALFIQRAGAAGLAWLPAAIGALRSLQPLPRRCWSLARLRAPVSAEATRPSPEALHADLWLYAEDGVLCAHLQGLVLRPADVSRLSGPAGAARPAPLYRVAWVEQPAPASAAQPERPTLAALQAAAAGPLREALATPALQRYQRLLPQLNALAAGRAAEALAVLARVDARAGAAAPLSPALLALKQRLQHLADPTRLPVPLSADTATEQARLAAEHPEASAELDLLAHCARGLPAVLAGHQSPMAWLFAEGRAAQLATLYGDSPGAALANRLAADAAVAWVQGLARSRTAGRPLRVLEIGAGTGGSTAHVWPRLQAALAQMGDGQSPATLEYHFSDLSPTLLAQAQQRFGPALHYVRFDVEQPPAAQALPEGGFDLVLAANVLHATADLRRSLAHTQALLAPGGLLLLLELTRPQAWLDLIFGLTEGWWRFADHALRPDHALLPGATWLQLLHEPGWAGAVALTASEAPADAKFEEPAFGVFAATRAAPVALAPQRLRVEAPDEADAADLALQLLQQAQAVLAQAEAGTIMQGPAPLHLITQGATAAGGDLPTPQAAAAWGLARVLALEHPELCCRRIDLDPLDSPEAQAAQLATEATLDDAPTVAWRQGRRWVPRLQAWSPPVPESFDDALDPPTDWAWVIAQRGTPDGLQRQPLQPRPPGPGELRLRVQAAGLNMIDLLDTLGVLPDEMSARRGGLGVECAAEVLAVGEGVLGFAPGDAVIALAPGCWRSSITVPAAWVAPRPRGYSAAAAAALPAAGLTAWHALADVAGLRHGERVLIHAAAGGTGWAALTVARHLGARVHATASPGKWAALQLQGVEQVASSRTLDFRAAVLQATAGDESPGVHVVLNALSGDFIPASLACLKPGGRFIELGKRDIWRAEQVQALRPDVQYHCVDLMALAQAEPARIAALFEALVPRWSSGALPPLPQRAYPMAQAARALRRLQRAAHIGKLVLLADAPAPRVRADASYLVTGGFGGLGLATAEWLLAQGARHLVLLGRQARPQALSPALQRALQGADGARLLCLQADVADADALQRALQQAAVGMPPLRGVFHAAGHLQDGALRGLDAAQARRVLAPKLGGAWALHRLTQRLGLDLDFFVLYSSAAALLGSPGQAAHVAANAGLDALAAHRRARGLAATSLQWGPWSEIGAAADATTLAHMRARGIQALSPAQGLAALQRVLATPPADTPATLGVVDIDWPAFGAAGARRDPLFQGFAQAMAAGQGGAGHAPLNAPATPAANAESTASASAAPGWREGLAALPPAQRRAALVRRLQAEVAAVLGLGLGPDASRLPDPALGFFEMGLDSLMAVELRNRLAQQSGVALSAAGIFEHPTIHALAGHLAEQLWPVSAPEPAAMPNAESKPTPDDPIAAELAALDALLSKP